MAVKSKQASVACGCTEDWDQHPARYWLAQCRSLNSNPRQKFAAANGQGDSTPFEAAFANLAHSTLRDAAAKLLDYEVGFQLIEKNKDNSKAVGVFGFQLSGQWLYAPMFFLNGNLKGQELLYVKSQAIFVPLSDDFVNFFLGHKPPMLGKEVSRNAPELGIRSPDLQRLIRSPSKIASHDLPPIADWLVDFIVDLPKLALEKVSDDNYEAWALPEMIRTMGKTAVLHLTDSIGKSYPQVLQAFKKFHGEDTLTKIASEIAQEEQGRTGLNKLLSLPAARLHGSVLKFASNEPPTPEKLTVITRHDVLDGSGVVPMDRERKVEAVETGISVRDDREDREVAQVYREHQPLNVFNPSETGIYDVFVQPDKFVEHLVIMRPTGRAGRSDASLVMNVETKNWHLASPSHILCRARYADEKFQAWLEQQPLAKPSKLKGPAFLLHPDGNGTGVFATETTYGGDSEDGLATGVHWLSNSYLDDSEQSAHRQSDDFVVHHDDAPCRPSNPKPVGIERIAIHPNTQTISVVGGVLYVPIASRCIDVPKESKIIPYGSAKELMWAIATNDTWMDVKQEQHGVSIDGKKYDKMAALKHLILDRNLRQKAAEEVLQLTGESFRPLRFRIKAADIPRLVRDAPGADAVQDPPSYTDSFMGSNLPTEYPYERGHRVSDLSASTYGPPPRLPDPDTMNLAQQAASKGEKQLFDTAVFQSMLAANKQDTIVGRKLGDLIKGMHAKGCIYFQFLWHGEAFEDRYGAEELPNIEDGLRTAFEADGKLVLALKQRSVEPTAIDGIRHDLDTIGQ